MRHCERVKDWDCEKQNTLLLDPARGSRTRATLLGLQSPGCRRENQFLQSRRHEPESENRTN